MSYVSSLTLQQPSADPETPLTSLLKKKENRRQIEALLTAFPLLVDTPNRLGETPFQLAVDRRYVPLPADSMSFIRLFLDRTKQPSNAATALYEATWRSDSKALEILLAYRPKLPLDIQNTNGRTPLHEAVIAGHFENLMKLLESGADPTVKDRWGRSPLHLAACNTRDDPCFAVALLNKGALLDDADSEGCSALMMAILEGNVEIVRELLQKGANPICFHKGISSIVWAAQHDQVEILDLLLGDPRTNLNLQVGGSTIGGAALVAACANGSEGSVKKLIPKVSPQKNPACLLQAICNSHWNIVHHLLANKIKPDIVSEEPPHDSALCLAIRNRSYSTAHRLIEEGADVNYCNQRGECALTLALNQMEMTFVKDLLNHGASLSRTILVRPHGVVHYSSGFKLISVDIVNLMVDCWKEKDGNLLLFLAAFCKYEEPIRRALAKGSRCDQVDDFGTTPLHRACQLINVPAMKVLLEHSQAVINRPNSDRRTPLGEIIYQIASWKKEVLSLLPPATPSSVHEESREAIQLLLSAGADLDCVMDAESGSTPRSLARQEGLEHLFASPASSSSQPVVREMPTKKRSIDPREETSKEEKKLHCG